MTDYNVDDGVVLALPDAITLATASSILSGQIWMEFTVPAEGADPSLTFAIGAQGYSIVTSGGIEKRIYAGIKQTAALRKFLSVGESAANVELIADARVTPINGTGTYRIREILRDKNMFDAIVTFYQWDDTAGAPAQLWSGYWRGVDRTYTSDRITIMSGKVSSLPAREDLIISDVISQASFSTAPSDSYGKMVPRAYGNLRTGIVTGVDFGSNASIFLGHGSRFIEGVVVDANQTALKLNVRFTKNDGIAGCAGVNRGSLSNSPFLYGGDLWIWIQSAGTYAQIEPSSYSIVNDTGATSIIVDAEPTVYIALRPGGPGSQMAAGLTASAYKITDDDATNFVETTSTDFKIAFNIPSVSIPGLSVQALLACWHIRGNNGITGPRSLQLGVWDDFNTAAAGWLGNTGKFETIGTAAFGESMNNMALANWYVAGDFAHHVGNSTIAEFSSGNFIGRDTNQADTPLQLFMQAVDVGFGKDGIQVYGCGLIVKGKIALERSKRITRSGSGPTPGYDIQGRPRDPGKFGTILGKPIGTAAEVSSADLASASNQLVFLATGQFQKDLTGVYDVAGQEIRKGVSVGQHILSSIGGMAVNMSIGSLGNFPDAKVEEVAGEKSLDAIFGPQDVSTVGQAKDQIQKRHPIRFHQKGLIWNCFYNEMNPHPSRFYRAHDNFVRISARRHILDGSLEVMQIPFEQIINFVTVNYGHAYGSNRAMRSFHYDNYLSQLLFGTRPELIVDEPWITCNDLTIDAEPAKFLARFLGRFAGRPLLTPINVKLSRELSDLECGHVVGFDTDMEDVGYFCPAYRCGKFNNAYPRSGPSLPNQAFSAAPVLVPSGGITSETTFFADQQFGGATFGIPGGGTYTTVANGWEYYSGAGSWTALTNVQRSDGGDPLAVFKAAAGIYKVTWDMPDPSTWKKVEFAIGTYTDAVGPQYPVRMKYNNSTVSVVGTQQSAYDAKWFGRLFECIEASRKPGAVGDYPYVDAVLSEVM